jgi:hypothetical protein
MVQSESCGRRSYFGLKPGCWNVTVHNGFERLMGVPFRMPGRSGPANGRESTADENVPVPTSPLVHVNGR